MLNFKSKCLIIFLTLFFFSCSNTYELEVELEASQKYFFVFNSDTTYPEKSFTKEIDIDNDSFHISKIKYIPKKKWTTTRFSDQISSWGQAGIFIKVTKTSGILSSKELLFSQYLDRFYNPNIVNITEAQKNEIQKYNPDIDSGLGDSIRNNSFNWSSFTNQTIKAELEFESNFRHTLVKKYSPDIRDHNDIPNLNELNRRFIDGRTQLFTSDISKCSAYFPHKPQN